VKEKLNKVLKTIKNLSLDVVVLEAKHFLQDTYVYTRGCEELLDVYFSQFSRIPNARIKVLLER
jgi:hypothetical protein